MVIDNLPRIMCGRSGLSSQREVFWAGTHSKYLLQWIHKATLTLQEFTVGGEG